MLDDVLVTSPSGILVPIQPHNPVIIECPLIWMPLTLQQWGRVGFVRPRCPSRGQETENQLAADFLIITRIINRLDISFGRLRIAVGYNVKALFTLTYIGST